MQAKKLSQTVLYGVLTDVDGTLTLHGQLRASTYEALWSLHHIGLTIIPVTGRSAAWGHMMLHQWPIDAVIAESGGLAMWRVNSSGDLVTADQTRSASVSVRNPILRRHFSTQGLGEPC